MRRRSRTSGTRRGGRARLPHHPLHDDCAAGGASGRRGAPRRGDRRPLRVATARPTRGRVTCWVGARRPRRLGRDPVTSRLAMRQRKIRDAKTRAGTDRVGTDRSEGGGPGRARRPWERRLSPVVRRASPIATYRAGCPRATLHRDPQAGAYGLRARRPGLSCCPLHRHGVRSTTRTQNEKTEKTWSVPDLRRICGPARLRVRASAGCRGSSATP